MDIHFRDQFGNEKSIGWELSRISKTDVDFGHVTRLVYDSSPPQAIEVEQREFPGALKRLYPDSSFAKTDMVATLSGKWKWIAAIFAVLLGLGAFAFLVVMPSLAEYAAAKVPLTVERSIGESAYGQLTAFAKEDAARSRRVQEFFENLPVERKYDYTITVVNSDEKNAFALPGGRIVVYSGIIESMERSEELSALLLHESAHVELRHSLKSLFRTLSGYFFISLLFGDTGGITAVVFENIYVFKDLQYSREMERQADLTGLKWMRQAGIDPVGMEELFLSLKDEEPLPMEKYKLSEFMSTHPLTRHRIEYIRQYIAGDTTNYTPSPALDSLFSRIKAN